MKQPELGKKIVELRNSKGLTQEELVEKCNISVRTIQRIEAGEVTPRSYTVKIILNALDYDLSKMPEENTSISRAISNGIRGFLLLDVDMEKPSTYIIQQLNIAWIMGILYFMVGFLEAAAEYFRYEEDSMIFGNVLYVTIKIAILITFIYFQRGFILVGGLFKNYLLKIVSFILIFGHIIVIGYDIASIFYDSVEREFVLGAEALTFGGIAIVFGIALFRLNRSVGSVASVAGIFEVVAGFFLVTIVLAFLGLFVLIPAELLEIIILYKTVEILRSKMKEEYMPENG